jgi:hypothetical protein
MSSKWVLCYFLTWASPLNLSILFVELLLSIFVCSLWSVFSRLVGFPLVVLMFCYWKNILLHFVHLQEDSIYQVLVHWLKIEQMKSNFVSVCNLVIYILRGFATPSDHYKLLFTKLSSSSTPSVESQHEGTWDHKRIE